MSVLALLDRPRVAPAIAAAAFGALAVKNAVSPAIDQDPFWLASAGRLLVHTGWRSRGEVALQYTYVLYGSGIEVDGGYPPMLDPTINPDRNVFSLIGTFWW